MDYETVEEWGQAWQEAHGIADDAERRAAFAGLVVALRRAVWMRRPVRQEGAGVGLEERLSEVLVADGAFSVEALRRVLDADAEAGARPRVQRAAGVARSTLDLSPVLAMGGTPGAVLVRGECAVLSGEGAVGKNGLLTDLALGVAALGDGVRGKVCGGVFEAIGGRVVFASWEEDVELMGDKLRSAAAVRGVGDEVLGRVERLGMAGVALYGPPGGEDDPAERQEGEGEGGARVVRPGQYNARPVRLEGWDALWGVVEEVQPVLVVVEPLGAAYVGDPGNAQSVRELTTALRLEARRHGVGLLLGAHATKSSRTAGSKGDAKAMAKALLDEGGVAGAAAWTDAMRGVIRMGYDPDGGDWRRLVVLKANLGMAYRTMAVAPRPAEREGAAFAGTVAFDPVPGERWERVSDWLARIQEKKDEDGGGGVPAARRQEKEPVVVEPLSDAEQVIYATKHAKGEEVAAKHLSRVEDRWRGVGAALWEKAARMGMAAKRLHDDIRHRGLAAVLDDYDIDAPGGRGGGTDDGEAGRQGTL